MNIITQLIQEFKLKPFQVQNVVKLLDEGNTIPFIARYRKEATGELNDQVLRELYERLEYLRNLEQRRNDVKRLIDEQGKLTGELEKNLEKAVSLQEIEDIYRPYKPKRKTRASMAREKGLEPLANALLLQNPSFDIVSEAKKFISDKMNVYTAEDALNGAMDIIAEEVSDNAAYRKAIREKYFKTGLIETTAKKDEDSVYRMYYDFREPVCKIANHRVLAINRGEKEGYIQVTVNVNHDEMISWLTEKVLLGRNSPSDSYIKKAVEDSYYRLIAPSIEREIRNELTENAEEQAMKVFSQNLKNLLLQPPVKGKVVLGLDPAYRTGCKIAVVDPTGKVLDTTVIYPTPPQNKVEEAKQILKKLILVHNVDIISIGNGTASKESEIFVAQLLKEINKKVYYMVVSESGASVYSASKLGAEEFPDFDVSLRSAVSIARRLQDPLAELVKIDPKSIGVGQYQHDMNQKRLGESLTGVVEYCVNSVGVDLNTASPSLLSYIAGINSTVAKNIVNFREQNGRFTSRKQLLKVKNLGEKAFEQCAGFLRIPDSENVLDNTSVHPESYNAALNLLKILGYDVNDVKDKKLEMLPKLVELKGYEKLADEINVGIPTLKDIVSEMIKPGRDPREDLQQPVLLSDVIHLEDLKPGMIMTGTIRNVADFGAFVDIGVHQDGLVHISELSDKFIKNPMEVVSVGDIVKVKILDLDIQRKRISLSMKGL